MGLIARSQFISVSTVLGLVFLLGKGTCDSTCPDGITHLTASSGLLAYPSSGDYGINETKCWKIEVPDTYRGIYYYFNRYDVEVCKRCECDRFQIVQSSAYSSLKFGVGKGCGQYSDTFLESRRLAGNPFGDTLSDTTIYVRFQSDDTVHRRGFNFSFIAYSNKGGDKSYLNATGDKIIEFGTPKVGIEKYPTGFGHQWILIVPKGRQVQIDFDIFELEKSENCKNDYVEVREAYFEHNDPTKIEGYSGPFLTGRLCGSSKPSTIRSSGNMVWVQFWSDYNATTVYKGFKASFKAVGGQGRLSVSNPLTLLFLLALLVVASKNSLL